MALVKFNEKPLQSTWKKRDKKAARHLIVGQEAYPQIDYGKLRELISIDGLRGRDRTETTAEAHQLFMARYKQMFVPDEPRKGLPIHVISRSVQRLGSSHSQSELTPSKSVLLGRTSITSTLAKPDQYTHNIKDYVAKYRRAQDTRTEEMKHNARIKTLRKLLRKLPFERNAADVDEILACIKHFPVLTQQLDEGKLRELALVATLDVWKDPGVTIFGNVGLHIILKGNVQPYGEPCLKLLEEEVDIPCPTPEPEVSPPELGVCDAFGTLVEIPDREVNSHALAVKLVSDHVELMLITCSQFKKINEKMSQDREMKRIELLQKSKPYHLWSRQPLIKMAAILTFADFPPNTVLVSEGYVAPFAAIICSGECHVMRQVDIVRTRPDGKKEPHMKQVLMGQLGPRSTFGEVSIILEETMTCTILTASHVKLAIVEPQQLKELDKTTVQLLLQSSERTYAHLSLDAVREEYVKQEMKREWNTFKHNTIVDTINSRGIRPGYGKWAKN